MAEAPVPVSEWPAYSVNPQGGDPITQDLNAPYDKVGGSLPGTPMAGATPKWPLANTECQQGDLCWILVCTILCWQITPAM